MFSLGISVKSSYVDVLIRITKSLSLKETTKMIWCLQNKIMQFSFENYVF